MKSDIRRKEGNGVKSIADIRATFRSPQNDASMLRLCVDQLARGGTAAFLDALVKSTSAKTQ